ETLARLGGKFASRCGPTSAAVILDRIGLLARVKPPMAALHDAAERELRAAGVRLRSIPASAKLNDNDPQAWLADVLARLPGHPGAVTNCCLGIGSLRASLAPPMRTASA